MILRPLRVLLATLAILPQAAAQPVADKGPAAAFTPPKAPSIDAYRGLAENSPFTVRADPVIAVQEEPFPDIKLIGYMPLGGRMNAWVQPADSEDPIQLVEGVRDEKSGLLLIGINGPESLFTAVAEIEANGKRGSLRFTDAGIIPAPGAGPAKSAPAANKGQRQPPGIQNPQLPPPTTTPRRRIILPQ